MFYTLALFAALYLSTLTLMVGSGLLGSLLSLRMSLEGFAHPVIGLVMAGFYLGLVAGGFVCPAIVRRVGHIRAFAAFSATNATAVLLYPLFFSALTWFAFRLLTGLSMMGLYMVLESWLNDRTEAHMRGRVFSVYMAMTFLGLGSGQLMLRLKPISGNDLFLISAIFTIICLVPLVLTRSIHPELPEVTRLDPKVLLRRAPLGVLGASATGAIASSFYSLGPVFAERSGIPVPSVSLYLAVTILSGLVLQWPVGNLSDRYDRIRVLSTLATLLVLASLFIIVAVERSLGLLLASSALYGGLAFTLYPVAVAHTNDHLERDEIVPASAVLIFCYGLGACIGPLLASISMILFGPRGLYLFIALCATGLAAAAILFRRRKPLVPKPSTYIPVPRTSHIIGTLDPRGHASAPDPSAEAESAGEGYGK